MHLLAAKPGRASDGSEPIDPAQSPADVVILTAADTEIAALSAARMELGSESPSLRLGNLSWFAHPYTVDLYLSDTAGRSRLAILRCLGGTAYWRYAVEQFAARLGAAGVPLALLPGGDDEPDAELIGLSTVAPADYERLRGYFVEGGPGNMENLLRHARHMLEGGEAPPAPKPLPRAGLYWPGGESSSPAEIPMAAGKDAPVAALVFYRALLQGAGLQPINRFIKALRRRGLNPLPIHVSSLKDPASRAVIEAAFAENPPDVVLNATAFAVGSPDPEAARAGTPLDATGAPVLQIVFSGGTENDWLDDPRGLGPRDIAMNVALPEVDGRILTRAVSFKGEAYFDEEAQCSVAAYRARGDRIDFVADLAANWVRLRRAAPSERKVAIVLANYPNRDGRLANGVGLDTPAATARVLSALSAEGYAVEGAPSTSDALMERLTSGPTNWLTDRVRRVGGESLPLGVYREWYGGLDWELRRELEERWGPPEADPFVEGEAFRLSIHRFGSVAVGLQPARGYNIDPEKTYHAPDLPPPHGYLAFHLWLRAAFGVHAVVHMGKHGNLEWLPGKALALTRNCLPEVALGPVPHVYPFIVNDPGEGAQAKRRAAAVIVDHLTPPLTRAETYGPLRDVEALVDEYYQAADLDPRRADKLRSEILSMTAATGLDRDAGAAGGGEDDRLARIDAYLCEIKEAQIRDGLHVFGTAPDGRRALDLTVALARAPRGDGRGGNASLHRALAEDLVLGFDPLDCDMAAPWKGPRPVCLELTGDPWRTAGDTVERLERLASAVVGGAPPPGPASAEVMDTVAARIAPAVADSGPAEMAGLLRALDGRHLAPGPSGAPTRGRLDTLPTGRNFFSVDSRAVPTRAAWDLGWRSASLLIERHLQDVGDWPRAVALTAWGTANMRTGGDDVAQALALMGARPVWDGLSGRVTGFEIIPADALGRPRVDVTLRISGFFRDAFPAQVDLIASAARAVMELDEASDINPAAGRFRNERGKLGEAASYRVYGSKPGAYGAGLQALVDERLWTNRSDFAEAFLTWGSYAYGAGAGGRVARAGLEARLSRADAVVQNQDNREHDILDSDDYYQFEGGLAASIEHLSGRAPVSYHNDHSRPERPVIRTLGDEMGRVVRSRAANPKWIAGVKRHGYKGAFEIAATVDYLFAFAATTNAAESRHFDLCYEAYVEDDDTRTFIGEANPAALREIAERFREAIDRGLWHPRSNSARARIDGILSRTAFPGEGAPARGAGEPSN